jgi:hypothetical protein
MFNKECKHNLVLAVPEKDVRIGGSNPHKCTKCGIIIMIHPKRRK